MFSQACVKNSVHPRQTSPLGRPPKPPLPSDGHCSGWYASYWNAFLFKLSYWSTEWLSASALSSPSIIIESDTNWNNSWNGIHMKVFTLSDLLRMFKSLRFVFRVGPLHSDTKYSVGAEKEGYILTASTTHQGSFKAFKLGEIIVKVRYWRGFPDKVLLYFSNGWASVVTVNAVLWMFNFGNINGWMFG